MPGWCTYRSARAWPFFACTLILCAFGAICQNFAIDRIFKNFLSCLCCKLKAQGCARDT